MSPRHRCEYAADLPHSLPDSMWKPPKEFPASQPSQGSTPRCAPLPAQIRQVRAGRAKRDVTTPVPLVLLSITLTGPAPSGSTGTSRLCQGCSHPPRHHPGQAAPSSTALLRQGQRRRSPTSTRINNASWRTHIQPYNPLGPPGQTNTQNLAPLGRFTHRVKTHAHGWNVRRLDPKTLEWTTPHGVRFHVDPTGTHRVRGTDDG